MNLRIANWRLFLLKTSIISAIVILANWLVVIYYGSTIWFYAGYLFGNDIKTTLSTLLFIEGAAILALGFVWASGSMEINFDGSNIKTNIWNRNEQWKQRSNELGQENTAGKVMIFVGLPVLILSLILIFV
ncbi:MAG: hypothetical protein ABSA79_06855 [Candidatus Bathyarchaeia archaeon]